MERSEYNKPCRPPGPFLTLLFNNTKKTENTINVSVMHTIVPVSLPDSLFNACTVVLENNKWVDNNRWLYVAFVFTKWTLITVGYLEL